MFCCFCHVTSTLKGLILALPYCLVHGLVHGFIGNIHPSSKISQNHGAWDADVRMLQEFSHRSSTCVLCTAQFFPMLGSYLYSVETLLNMEWQRKINVSCEMYGVSEINSLSRYFMAQFWTPRRRQTMTVPRSDVTARSSTTRGHEDTIYRAIGLS
jgi:hypothetical protein